MDKITDQFVEHEVQLRLLNTKNEEAYKHFDKIDERFDKFEAKFDTKILMLVGLISTSIIIPVVLHVLRLV